MNKLIPVCLLILSASCRPVKKSEGDTETKSLDNVGKTSAEQTRNYCGIDYTGTQALGAGIQAVLPQIEATMPKHKNAVIGALTAVPENLSNPFFKAGGRIVVTADAKNKCKDTPVSQAEREMTGTIESIPACWKIESGKPVIYLLTSVNLIHHNLVRMFGYFYTEFFVNLVQNAAAPAPLNDAKWKEAATAFVAERDALANSFLLDLSASNKALHDQLLKIQTLDSAKFGNYIFAEALDSYYCSTATRQTFSQSFKTSYTRFTDKGNANSVVNQFGAR